ncbi:MAG: replication endonuclease [Acidithiobacillus ferrivorans]
MTAKTANVGREVGIDARDERIKTFAKMYADAAQQHMRVSNAGITYAEEKLGHGIQGDTIDSQLARIQDPSFWRREIRKALRPWRELWHLALAPQRLKYASPEAIAEYRSMQVAGEKWAKAHEMTAPDGRTFTLPTPAETAKNRYAQLVAMTKGIETLASDAGMTAHIITISLDTQFHSAKNEYKNGPRISNPKYDQALTPRAGQAFLNERWKLYRTALHDHEIRTYWVLGAQPNQDETPHWHIVLWCKDEQKEQAESLLYDYFKTNDAKEKKGDGSIRYVQVDWQEAKSEQGSSSYAMRMLAYITRQTAEQKDDATDVEQKKKRQDADMTEAEAASAWASTWNIRRYRTSHTGATLWKMARNPDCHPALPTQHDQKPLEEIRKVAQAGDFAEFYKLTKTYRCKILYTNRTGKYGDAYKSPRGIEYTARETGEITTNWKQTSWTLTRLPENVQSNQQIYSYLKEPRAGEKPPPDYPDPPNPDPLPHWNDAELAEWAEFLEYKQTQQVAKLAKTA